MTRDQSARHKQNLARLDRQLAIAANATRPGHTRRKAARWAASLGERLGMITRPGRCEFCRMCKPLERHHPAYDQPLHVLYLCRSCHEIADGMDGTGEHRPRRAS